jgi:hypothetical protein
LGPQPQKWLFVLLGCAAVAGAGGCAHSTTAQESARSGPPVVTEGEATRAPTSSTDPATRSSQERAPAEAADFLVTADLELRDLREMRARATDPAVVDSLDRQINAITRWRDAVQVDRAAPEGSPSRARLEADMANLERAMAEGAAAEPQAPSPPPIQRRDTPPAGSEALPPDR